MCFGNSALTGNKLLGWLFKFVSQNAVLTKKNPKPTHLQVSYGKEIIDIHYLGRFLICLHWSHTDPHTVTGGNLRSFAKISALCIDIATATAMAGKAVGLFHRETKRPQFSLANSICTWSWLFPIHSRACEIKHFSAEKGYATKGKTAQSLCFPCCVDVLQLPYIGD